MPEEIGIVTKLVVTWSTVFCVFLNIFICRTEIWMYKNMFKEELRSSNKFKITDAILGLVLFTMANVSLLIINLLLIVGSVEAWFF